nr:hypothetical protein [Candidatus Sigynarchaeota archaeon]
MTPGRLFFIVGNSASGKDSLLNYAVTNWKNPKQKLLVAQRFITRPESPETEKFISVTDAEFTKMDKKSPFLFKWISYKLNYGVKKDILKDIKKGHLVIVNVSRQIVDDARKRFPDLKVIFVKVPVDLVVKRLQERGRENDSQIQERIQRAKETGDEFPGADFVVENTGTIEEGGKKLLAYFESFC